MSIAKEALNNNAASDTLYKNNKRISSAYDLNITLGSTGSAKELAVCYPIGYNKSTQKFGPWMAPDPTVLTVNTGGASGGVFKVTVNGVTAADIAYNATAATVEAILKDIGYDVSVSVASGVYTITFDAQSEIEVLPTVTGDVSGLTGATSPAATPAAGTATYGLNKIRGFINPEAVTTSTTQDTIATMMITGEIYYTEATELVDSGDVTALEAALKDDLVGKGLIVQGLPGIY